jgi:hypothetical protein
MFSIWMPVRIPRSSIYRNRNFVDFCLVHQVTLGFTTDVKSTTEFLQEVPERMAQPPWNYNTSLRPQNDDETARLLVRISYSPRIHIVRFYASV